jgi:hypothetical protein
MGKKAIQFLLLSFVSAFVLSCTRDLDENSKLNFDLSSLTGSQNSQSGSKEINFLAINVSGSGGRVICSIDPPRNDNDPVRWSGPCKALSVEPLVIEMTGLRVGKGQKVQVLAIVKEQDTEGNEQEFFNYGDAIANIGKGANVVDVQMIQAPQATNKESNVTGRYRDLNGSYYTGKVELQFTPPAEAKVKEPMTIFVLEIFDGWFDLPLLDNIDITYRRVQDGRVLFNRPVNLNLPIFDPDNGNMMRVDAPETYYSDSYEDSGYGKDDGRSVAVGFWREANSANGVVVQIDNAPTICKDLTTYVGNEYTDEGVTKVEWPTNFTIDGGVESCGDDFIVEAQTIAVNGEAVVNSDGGGGALFFGPYKKFLGTHHSKYSFVDFEVSEGQPIVKWRYLPGVVGGEKVYGTAIFYKQDKIPPEFEGRINDGGPGGFDCRLLEAAGFTRRVATGNAEQVTLSGVTPDIFQDGKVVMCPMRTSSTYWDSVLDLSDNGDDDCGDCSPPATKLAFADINGNDFTYYNENACTPVYVVALDSSDNLARPPGHDYVVDVTAGYGSFYTGPDCTTAATTVTMHGPAHMTFYQHGSTQSGEMLYANSNVSESESLTSGSKSVDIVTGNSQANVGLILPPHDFYDTECSKVMVYSKDGGEGAPVGSAGSGLVNISSTLGGTFYANNDCGGSSNSSLGAGGSLSIYGVFEYQPTAVTGDQPGTMTTINDMGQGNDSYVINVIDVPEAEYAVIEGGDPTDATCEQFRIATYWTDPDSFRPVRAVPSGTVTYTLSEFGDLDSAAFSQTSGSCSPTSNTATQTAVSSVDFYFQGNDVSAPKTFTINVSADNNDFDASREFELQP